tara:strand:+ start:1458 stop:1640 length:183 start_codon:yes stop_codon:yes gene_type:complete
MDCVICGIKIAPDHNGYSGGCNAEPVAKGYCCSDCDANVVIPTRISLMFGKKEDKKGEVK